jgi:hypothetical protein
VALKDVVLTPPSGARTTPLYPRDKTMYNDLKRMIETHARTEGCTEQAALRDLTNELQALAADMGLDLKAVLAVTPGDLSDQEGAIQDGRECQKMRAV